MAHKAIRLEVDEFIDHFFKSRVPAQAFGTPPARDSDVFNCLAEVKDMKEEDISKLFVDVVNRLELAPGLRMSQSEHKPDVGDATQEKIDSAFFRTENCPTDGRPHWAEQIVAVEFKRHDTRNDPYTDSDATGTVDAYAETRRNVRSQLISYAEKLFEYQHRTELYMFIIIGRTFRITRWDRSGTLVTRRMDYVSNPQVLCDVLWYISQMTNTALGFDPSAERVVRGSAYYTMMNKASFSDISDVDHTERILETLPEDGFVYKYVREMFRESLQRNWPRYRLEVPDGDGTRSFLVAKPVFQAPGMAGRGTRGYVALDLKTGRFVWLKDAWRTHYELVDQEGAVLATLNEAKVANVPTLICHGDILGQVTETPKWWELKNPRAANSSSSQPLPLKITQPVANVSGAAPGASVPGSSERTKRSASDMERTDYREDCPLRRHKHYRLVVAEVGMKLTQFQSGQQLVKIVYDCVAAHRDAVTKADILHRDISGGNILIFPRAITNRTQTRLMRWGGLLVDWELSKPIAQKDVPSRARQPERTGTLQFMSVAMLNETSKVVEIPDELESFFHVILYHAVRYLTSNCTDVGVFIEDFFDSYSSRNGELVCGEKKQASMITGHILLSQTMQLYFDSPLDGFMEAAMKWFRARYVVRTYHSYQSSSSMDTASTHAAAASTKPPKSLVPYRRDARFLDTDDIEDSDSDDESPEDKPRKAALPPAQPTEEEERDAAMVDTHAAFLKRLSKAMKSLDWQADRVEGDNVPPEYKPKRRVGPLRGASVATIKRRRTGIHTWALALAEDDDGLATPTPLKTYTARI